MEKQPPKIHLVSAEFYPAFRGGRVERMRALAEYLHHSEFNVAIHSFASGQMVEPEFDYLDVFSYFSPYRRQRTNDGGHQNAWLNQKIQRLLTVFERTLLLWDRYFYFVVVAIPRFSKNISSGDIVIVSCPWFSILILACYLLIRRPDVSVVIDYRDLWDSGPFQLKVGGRRCQHIFQKYVLTRAELVTVTSDGQAKHLRHYYGIESKVILNGVRASDIKYIQEASRESKHRTKDSGRVIGYFGSVGGRRDLSSELDMLASLHEISAVKVYGDAPGLVFDDQKISMNGFVTDKSLAIALEEADFLFVFISNGEGAFTAVPSKIFLYMAAGKPIIVSAPSGSEVIRLLDGLEYPYISLIHACTNSKLWDAFFHRAINTSDADRARIISRDAQFEKLKRAIG